MLPSPQILFHPILFKPICPNPLSELRLDAQFRRYSHFKFLEERKKEKATGWTNDTFFVWLGQMTHFMYRSNK
jgi:hypothetical protein